MLGFLLSVLGFVVLTAAVIAMARTDTARWEREKAVRAHNPAHRHPAGAVPPHARRRRVEFMTAGPPVPRAPAPVDSRPRAPLPVGAERADGPAPQGVS